MLPDVLLKTYQNLEEEILGPLNYNSAQPKFAFEQNCRFWIFAFQHSYWLQHTSNKLLGVSLAQFFDKGLKISSNISPKNKKNDSLNSNALHVKCWKKCNILKSFHTKKTLFNVYFCLFKFIKKLQSWFKQKLTNSLSTFKLGYNDHGYNEFTLIWTPSVCNNQVWLYVR